ncbi:AimR family lysis-lysogeny pheromone receptor [Halobacillus campisalis]|uniref:AimR family lysis-lysogeny pheromone receptor n=1 Tax=Halobacillus campisalis TaxID=435909 RepID=A0ABW2K7P2_9BACI|nr:AimR family lysis-lysogeny pheromone receptor [Halobacillus campisalis]
MGCHNLIEPSPITQIQIKQTSTVYKTYHQLLKVHSRTEATTLVKDYCLNTSPKTFEDQLAYLEFLYMNDFYQEAESLLNTEPFTDEATALYQILLDRKKSPLTYQQLRKLESLEFQHPSTQCLHFFTIVYGYYDLKRYTGLDKYMEDCFESLNKVNEPLFHYFMKLRFEELAFQHYWKTNNILLAKKHAYKYLNKVISPHQLCKMNHILALCHVFDSFEYSFEYAQTALEIAKDYELESSINSIENHTIPFICAFHQRTEHITTADPIETAHLAIADRDFKKAQHILLPLKNPTPFQQTYLGVATNSKEMLISAHERFKHENGDLFFANLPIHYLNRYLF